MVSRASPSGRPMSLWVNSGSGLPSTPIRVSLQGMPTGPDPPAASSTSKVRMPSGLSEKPGAITPPVALSEAGARGAPCRSRAKFPTVSATQASVATAAAKEEIRKRRRMASNYQFASDDPAGGGGACAVRNPQAGQDDRRDLVAAVE